MSISPFTPADLPALVAFLNEALRGPRHWAPITPDDYAERVLSSPAFDPAGLILARAGDRVVGGVHALKPPPPLPVYQGQPPRHAIAWLAVAPDMRGQGLGTRLLNAAEDYLYYCPVYFAWQNTPLYGVIERLWAPWYGSSEHMAVSAIKDREQIAWLGRRGYNAAFPGDVTLVQSLHNCERPADPGLAGHGLTVTAISERTPWLGDEPAYRLRAWGANGGRPYHGLVIADGDRAIGSIVWYPLPDQLTAAVAWLGIERQYRGLRFGAYLLERSLAEMASRGYLQVEAHVHSRRQVEALGLFRSRGFQVRDYWVNLVKT